MKVVSPIVMFNRLVQNQLGTRVQLVGDNRHFTNGSLKLGFTKIRVCTESGQYSLI